VIDSALSGFYLLHFQFYLSPKRAAAQDLVAHISLHAFRNGHGDRHCVRNAQAVIEAIIGKKSEFPAPKLISKASRAHSRKNRTKTRRLDALRGIYFGLYFSSTVGYASATKTTPPCLSFCSSSGVSLYGSCPLAKRTSRVPLGVNAPKMRPHFRPAGF